MRLKFLIWPTYTKALELNFMYTRRGFIIIPQFIAYKLQVQWISIEKKQKKKKKNQKIKSDTFLQNKSDFKE